MNYLYLESICMTKLTSWITIDDCTSEIRIHSNNAYECQTNTLKHPNMAVDIIINNTVVTFYQMSKSQSMMNSSQWERENEHWIKQLKIRKNEKRSVSFEKKVHFDIQTSSNMHFQLFIKSFPLSSYSFIFIYHQS